MAPTTTPPTAPTLPRPLIDTDTATGYIYPTAYTTPSGEVIYTQYVMPSTSLTTATNRYTDTPYMELADPTYYYDYIATFKDTLMFNCGGIWVPLGSITWSISMEAGYNTTTGKWYATYTPIATPTYAATTTFPSWNDSYRFLQNTYGFVKTTP